MGEPGRNAACERCAGGTGGLCTSCYEQDHPELATLRAQLVATHSIADPFERLRVQSSFVARVHRETVAPATLLSRLGEIGRNAEDAYEATARACRDAGEVDA